MEGFKTLHQSRGDLLSGQVRGELERQSLVTGQSLAFLVHLEGPLLQSRKDRGDFVQVQVGRDSRVTRALDHRPELSILDLLEGPLQRIVDDGQVPVGPVVLVARTVMVMRALPETVERQNLGLFDIGLAFRAADVSQNMDRKTAVTVPLPPHLEAEPDVAGFKNVRATVVLHRVALADERVSR